MCKSKLVTEARAHLVPCAPRQAESDKLLPERQRLLNLVRLDREGTAWSMLCDTEISNSAGPVAGTLAPAVSVLPTPLMSGMLQQKLLGRHLNEWFWWAAPATQNSNASCI